MGQGEQDGYVCGPGGAWEQGVGPAVTSTLLQELVTPQSSARISTTTHRPNKPVYQLRSSGADPAVFSCMLLTCLVTAPTLTYGIVRQELIQELADARSFGNRGELLFVAQVGLTERSKEAVLSLGGTGLGCA